MCKPSGNIDYLLSSANFALIIVQCYDIKAVLTSLEVSYTTHHKFSCFQSCLSFLIMGTCKTQLLCKTLYKQVFVSVDQCYKLEICGRERHRVQNIDDYELLVFHQWNLIIQIRKTYIENYEFSFRSSRKRLCVLFAQYFWWLHKFCFVDHLWTMFSPSLLRKDYISVPLAKTHTNRIV